MKEFLPRIKEVRDGRKPMRIVMTCIICAPILVALILAGSFLFKDVDPLLQFGCAGVLALCLYPASLGFAYLGKLQSCDDILVKIDLAVIMGNAPLLDKCIANLDCMGRMRGMMTDALRMVRSVGDTEKSKDKEND
jgi:hypothetical protein